MKLTLTRWHRATFAVHLLPDSIWRLPLRAELVSGWLSGPFGIYAGTYDRIDRDRAGRRPRYTLVHLPSQQAQLTLPLQRLCRQAAAELAACDLAWESAWAPGVTGPDLEKVREVYRRWKAWGRR